MHKPGLQTRDCMWTLLPFFLLTCVRDRRLYMSIHVRVIFRQVYRHTSRWVPSTARALHCFDRHHAEGAPKKKKLSEKKRCEKNGSRRQRQPFLQPDVSKLQPDVSAIQPDVSAIQPDITGPKRLFLSSAHACVSAPASSEAPRNKARSDVRQGGRSGASHADIGRHTGFRVSPL